MEKKLNDINAIFWKIKEILQHLLKKQEISLLPNYIKLISRSVCANTGCF
jgi:hypothetical protein